MTEGDVLVNKMINYIKMHLQDTLHTDGAIGLCLTELRNNSKGSTVRMRDGTLSFSSSFGLHMEMLLGTVFTRRH